MTGIARRSARMFGGIHLWEILGLGDVLLVTAGAQDKRIQLGGRDRGWIVSVCSQRSMTGFAGHAFVYALALYLLRVAVTVLAHLMSGIADGQGSDLLDGVSPVMSVASKAVRHQETSYQQEQQKADQEDCCQAKKVSGISE